MEEDRGRSGRQIGQEQSWRASRRFPISSTLNDAFFDLTYRRNESNPPGRASPQSRLNQRHPSSFLRSVDRKKMKERDDHAPRRTLRIHQATSNLDIIDNNVIREQWRKRKRERGKERIFGDVVLELGGYPSADGEDRVVREKNETYLPERPRPFEWRLSACDP